MLLIRYINFDLLLFSHSIDTHTPLLKHMCIHTIHTYKHAPHEYTHTYTTQTHTYMYTHTIQSHTIHTDHTNIIVI